MSNPYWGQLPPPKVTRGNSLSLEPEGNPNFRGSNNLSVDTNSKSNRVSNEYPSQSQARHYRNSTQTEAPTVSTQSPFASPTASSFRGDGLAPRPPSFSYGAPDSAYNKDYLDKRRRRESRNREFYDEPAAIPPPAAPDAPRPAPPLSYKQPYSNVGPSSSYQAPVQSRSARRSDGPVSPSKAPPEDYYRSNAPGDYTNYIESRRGSEGTSRRPSNDKAVTRDETRDRTRQRPEQLDTSHSRKGSLSEAEAQRRREWAPDRSPLQRLELTLDSITKEEKRARVEEAELLAREAKAGRGGERASQNSVRFRNRPVAKASEAVANPEPQSLPEAGLVRNLSNRQKDQLQRSGTIERRRPSEFAPTANSGRGFDYQPKPEVIDTVKPEKSSLPQRGPSIRERSQIPVAVGSAGAAAGAARSTSKKLKKDPPGDPWFNRRVDAERQYQEVAPRRPSVSDRQQPMPALAGPSPGTAFRSHPQVTAEKIPVPIPKESRRIAPEYSDLDLDSADEMDGKPVKRGSTNKAEKLMGQKIPGAAAKFNQPARDIRTKLVTVNGIQYAVAPTAADDNSGRNEAHHRHDGHHHISNLLHRDRGEQVPADGIYVPTGRLDEWKKGGVALLAGELLDLEVVERTEAEKDKAWWEAGNTGKRRRSSTKQRKAEAYDGEYDENNGTVPPISDSVNDCEGCVWERIKSPKGMKIRPTAKARDIHYTGYDKTTKSKVPPIQAETWELPASSSPLSLPSLSNQNISLESPSPKPHSLICPTRAIRVRSDIAPTRFKPPLFLKSGPLLRYCGLRRESPQSRSKGNGARPEREIWRGSIMIVTQDSHSSYELAPTLRLFLQPTELLPPPPAQVDGEELAPEYIDPLAGLPKVGRDGRTLYIRPVDYLDEEKDLSRIETDEGLFELHKSPLDGVSDKKAASQKSHYDGEKAGKYKEVRGFRLHAEQGVTFWRFNLEIELRDKQQRIAYRINRGPATGFWVPARGETMNIMFHSCNGFSHGVDPNQFNGPDPMWRDVLNTHQTQPFHVMLGGGDQLYNDRVMEETTLFKQWCDIKDAHHKEKMPFTREMQSELETFYLNRYCMWFSQGLFGVAASQIPMVNIFDDHDIIDGYGSYPDEYMRSPIFSGLGCVAFKYYMLFQHQSSIDEGEDTESTWILGTRPGPYIKELSRSIFTNLGRSIAFLGLDCRTERMEDEVVSVETYHKVFDRLETDIIKGETKHLIVLLGIPMAYPRMVWLENILTSRFFQPVKALGRAGLLGQGLLNHMDGGVEILDDLDDHWTARGHKDERNWLIHELQDLAAEKSVRITILGGDVHLAAIGQFYSNPKLGIPKDRDFRYMPNVISSAIVNTPPPDGLADLLNKRNRVHHLDLDTDENMIPIFTHDVTGKPRNNKRLLNRRNWCSIREYDPEMSPPPTPQTDGSPSPPPRRGLLRRLSASQRGPSYRPDAATRPPVSNAGGFFNRRPSISRRSSTDSQRPSVLTRTLSLTRKDFLPGNLFRRNSSKHRPDDGGINGNWGADSEDDVTHYDDPPRRSGIRGGSGGRESEDGYFPNVSPATGREAAHPIENASTSVAGATPQTGFPPRGQFHRTPTGMSEKQRRRLGNQDINLEGGLDICLNVEVSSKDPAGITMPYRLLVPALWYEEEEEGEAAGHLKGGLKRWVSFARRKRRDGGGERFQERFEHEEGA